MFDHVVTILRCHSPELNELKAIIWADCGQKLGFDSRIPLEGRDKLQVLSLSC